MKSLNNKGKVTSQCKKPEQSQTNKSNCNFKTRNEN